MSASIIDECELIEWRKLQARIYQAVTSLLAAHGDSATRELIDLQHRLAKIGQASGENTGGHR